jgi:hypothetical protein
VAIDYVIVELQGFLRAVESGKVNTEEARSQLDLCYSVLNAKTLFRQGGAALNVNMDFAEARDELEEAIVALRNSEIVDATKHAKKALSRIGSYGSTAG